MLAEAEQIHRRGTACKTGCIDEAHYSLGLVFRALEIRRRLPAALIVP
jgi:hypothetical protein